MFEPMIPPKEFQEMVEKSDARGAALAKLYEETIEKNIKEAVYDNTTDALSAAPWIMQDAKGIKFLVKQGFTVTEAIKTLVCEERLHFTPTAVQHNYLYKVKAVDEENQLAVIELKDCLWDNQKSDLALLQQYIPQIAVTYQDNCKTIPGSLLLNSKNISTKLLLELIDLPHNVDEVEGKNNILSLEVQISKQSILQAEMKHDNDLSTTLTIFFNGIKGHKKESKTFVISREILIDFALGGRKPFINLQKEVRQFIAKAQSE